ncbi:uncharacterized protein [Macrobrachium rosenbergii]|uniref:uncharacterized protein isoform X13 n=1 Tax=Macrobrachium rosenbergii TaxID=79674 RepID=UPI0034D5B094
MLKWRVRGPLNFSSEMNSSAGEEDNAASQKQDDDSCTQEKEENRSSAGKSGRFESQADASDPSSSANRSFLHRKFVSDDSETHEYYDGRCFADVQRAARGTLSATEVKQLPVGQREERAEGKLGVADKKEKSVKAIGNKCSESPRSLYAAPCNNSLVPAEIRNNSGSVYAAPRNNSPVPRECKFSRSYHAARSKNSNVTTKGKNSHVTTKGKSNHVTTKIKNSHVTTKGKNSHVTTKGKNSHVTTKGKNSVSVYAAPSNNRPVKLTESSSSPKPTYLFGTKPEHLLHHSQFSNYCERTKLFRSNEELNCIGKSDDSTIRVSIQSVNTLDQDHYTFPRCNQPIAESIYDVPPIAKPLRRVADTLPEGYYSLPNPRRRKALMEDKDTQVSAPEIDQAEMSKEEEEELEGEKKLEGTDASESKSGTAAEAEDPHEYESFDFHQREKSSLRDALDFRDALGYLQAKAIRRKWRDKGQQEKRTAAISKTTNKKKKGRGIRERLNIGRKLPKMETDQNAKASGEVKKQQNADGNRKDSSEVNSNSSQTKEATRRLLDICRAVGGGDLFSRGMEKLSPGARPCFNTFPRLRHKQRPRPATITSPLISSESIPDGTYVELFPMKNMSALQLAAEGRDYLMWCPDQEFDNAVSALDIRGLVELVQTLQDAMAVEQQTFDSLTQQLELVQDPLQQQRLSAALCTSQTRLARLCSRNMRCFTQQALKARQRDGSESRSSSPRDSGLVVSSAGASDAEGDPRSPTGASFKHSLAFFQRAAHLMANNTRNCSLAGARQKEARRRSSRGSSCYGSSSSEAWSVASDDPAADHYAGKVMGGDLVYEDDLVNLEDQGTYEQVLFINGRPQYQDDISSTSTTTCGADRSRSGSWTRVRVDGSTGVGSAAGRASDSQLPSVSYSNSSLPRRGTANASTDTAAVAAEAQTQTLAADLNSYVTLPRRKPYLNFKSVACGSNSSSSSNHSNLSYINSASADFDNEDLRYFKERVGILKNNGVSTITRTQSFKEGLNSCSHEFGDQHNNPAYGLSRTQSFNDGLAGDFNDLESAKPKLQRVPSVDEILESVKTLRAKKTMVKSSPDLLSAQEPVYHSASLPRHKSSKGKAPRPSGTSALLGVRYNGTPSGDNVYERVPEPDYEQIPDAGGRFYENVCRGNNHYENIHLKGEVIYDSPRPTSEQHHHLHHHQHHPHHLYDKVHSDLHYENVKFDTPLYENIDEKEPTYMNVVGSKTNVYANLDAPANKKSSSSGSIKSSKSKSNKVTISGNSMMQGTTYDVPRAATHIYDSPQKQVRSVASSSSSSEYDTPKNNRSVLPQSTQIVLKAKSEQKQKIDDIFADCDKDSLEGDRDRAPDIPSPDSKMGKNRDYGSEEEGDGYEDASNDYVSSEFPDEGLGESDTRSYYTEDPAGLEVILEEPEDDYCSSHVSEDDLQREVDITYGLKGERRSLDGSEGIGSAEGDSHSSGGSEHYGEEDCASSGIHSEDTPSPGPPVDHEKEENQQDSNNKSQKRGEDDTRVQQDRCVEVYPETVRQRQRNMMTSANKVDIKNWTSSGNDTLTSPSKVKKFLPSVKALRNQFETGKTNNNRAETNGNGTTNGNLSRKSSISNSSVASSIEKTSSTNSLNSANGSVENLHSSNIENSRPVDPDEPVEPIYSQFKKVDEELRELMSKPPSTTGWNPRPLLKRLYYVPDAPKHHSQGTTYINIEGYLEKLPSGRKKATFWNAWKRRYFVAKDGVLYYYQNPQADKASMKMTLMGGKVECMEPSMVGVDDGSRDSKAGAMIGIDDGKGHYVVVRCSSKQEAERWRRALETHTVEDFASQYVQPWPIPTNPTMLRDTLIIDLGSCSVRAGVLASQATLPQVFFPSVVATERESRRQIWGFDALSPDVRSVSSVSFPVRPSHKISKYSVDLSAVSSLLQKAFADLKVDPKNYNIQLSVPRVLNPNTQAELLRLLFDKYGVKSVNLTHQSILALYAYNATSGIVVDIGDRLDIVPVIDGYIVDGGVSRVPYGGYRILDHLRQFLYMRNVSLINEVESYIIRQVLENICYCAHHYNTEKARCTNNPDNYEKGVSLAEYFQKDCPYEFISLDFGRFQATEGLFNPDAWGLDHPGIHKLVHKAIMECSMDIRKEMSRSIFLAGGVTQLPGLVERLTTEIDNLTPPAIRPKVHASPYRYHAAYIGACVLAESPAFTQSKITREDWNKHGNAALKKWSL